MYGKQMHAYSPENNCKSDTFQKWGNARADKIKHGSCYFSKFISISHKY